MGFEGPTDSEVPAGIQPLSNHEPLFPLFLLLAHFHSARFLRPCHCQLQHLPPALLAFASLDVNPNPWYAYRIPAFFMEQVQIAWAKRKFFIYSWPEDGEPPMIHRFQGGFICYIIIKKLLLMLEFSACDPGDRTFIILYQQPPGRFELVATTGLAISGACPPVFRQ